MPEIVIEVQTLAAMRPDPEPLGFPVAVNLEGLAGLDTGQDADQTLGNIVPGGYLPSQVVLAHLTGSQILDGAAGAPGHGQGGLLEASGHLENILAKVFQEHPQKGQAIVHALGIKQAAQYTPEDQTVKPRKRPHDICLIFLDKGFHGVFLSVGKFLAPKTETYNQRKTPAIF
jgi:hypothetical protein